MKARKTKQFPLFGGNILDECPDCGSAIVSIGFNRGICPSCARLEILSLRKQVKRLTKRVPDRLADGGRKHPARAIKQIKKLLAKHGGR